MEIQLKQQFQNPELTPEPLVTPEAFGESARYLIEAAERRAEERGFLAGRYSQREQPNLADHEALRMWNNDKPNYSVG